MILINRGTPSSKLSQVLSQIESDPKWQSIPLLDSKALRKYFDDDKHKAKITIRNDLILVQHHLCAYCMCPIEIRNANGDTTVKIEHYRPIDSSCNPNCKNDTYDYSNYFLCCMGGEQETNNPAQNPNGKRKKRILCCDSNKGNRTLTIDPTNEVHISHIQYRSDGVIEYFDSTNADETKEIQADLNEKLRLNGRWDPKAGKCIMDTDTGIVQGRKDAYTSAEEIVQQLIDEGRCTEAELKTQISIIQSSHLPFEGVYVFVFQMYINIGHTNADLPISSAEAVTL